uniref:alpha-1,2-Mannosidase n=2 Tax=Hirondellea gigas TaxID=1518452 RepID=A0A6A7FXZ2_9CRUS
MQSLLVEEGREYVTVALPPITEQSLPHSKSLRRRWNQLPRLLRVLLGVLCVFTIASIILYWTREPPSPPSDVEPPLPHLQQEQVLIAPSPQLPIEKEGTPGNEKIVVDVGIPGENNDLNQIPPPGSRSGRSEAVVAAMRHAWTGYRQFAWGHDHLKPISQEPHDWLKLGLTLIDALDTLWIMGLKKEFEQGREWVASELDFNLNQDVNLFETTIRVLGGLLSSYHLTHDKLFLDKAVDIADRLLAAFNSESGVPFSDVNLATRSASKPKWGPDSSTSEVTTIQLEFRDLSIATGNPVYKAAVERVSRHVHELAKFDGLVPIFINAQSGNWRPHATITLGARGDTYYEYLLKQWLQGGKKETWLLDDYIEAINGMQKHLARRTQPSNLLFFGELHGSSKIFVNKMDELTCFLPGTLALGHHYGVPDKYAPEIVAAAGSHLTIARDLMETCARTWLYQPTKLAPEITFYNTKKTTSNEDFFVKSNDAHYLLRPETIESLWYMFQVTGNTTYQDWGWEIFQGIEKYCRVTHGYTTIGNVRNPDNVRPKDMMESFFLGETLKYLYLLFSEDQTTYSIDHWVYNTEAHLLPMISSASVDHRDKS